MGWYKKDNSGKLHFRYTKGDVIYPIDVITQVAKSGKLSRNEALRTYSFLAIIGAIASFFIVSYIVRSTLGITGPIPIIIVGLLISLVAVNIWRYKVFDENRMLREYEQQGSDDFSRYMKLRFDVTTEIPISEYFNITVFELENGAHACFLRFRFGSTSFERERATRSALSEIYKSALNYGLHCKVVTMTENYYLTPEYEYAKETMKDATHMGVKSFYIKTLKESLSLTEKYADIDVMYIELIADSTAHKSALPSCVRQIVSVVNPDTTTRKNEPVVNTNFRQLSFLTKEEVLTFATEYYGLGTVDITSTQKSTLKQHARDNVNRVKVFKITTESGKVYSDPTLIDSYMQKAVKEVI